MQMSPGHVRAEVAQRHVQLVGPVEPARQIQLSLVLPLRNTSELNSFLRSIYDPASPQYRQFLSMQQFAQRFSPSQADYDAVSEFARENGFEVAPATPNRLVLPIKGTVAQIESTFHLRMNLYRAASGNRVFYSPDREPSVDRPLPLAHIAGLNDFSLPSPLVRSLGGNRPRAQAQTGSGPSGSYLAADMRAAYYGETSLTGAGQTIALVEFDGYRRSDVDLTLAPSGQIPSVAIQNVLLDGVDGTPTRGDDAEPVLDIVQAIGMAPGLNSVRVYIGSSDVDILNAIAAENLAQQVAISWTWSPDDPAVDDEFFLEMAAQGQSVTAASGDHGEFDPLMLDFYPAEDAWVTAVGGTHLLTLGPGGAWSGESAWLYSGGGISPDGIPLPWWQARISSAANGGSTTLRNVPDVAMEADFDNYLCVMGVCSGGWGGTSFAAARWAGFLALANEQAGASGAPPIGFLNSALYSIAQNPPAQPPIHDTVSGNNNAENGCCGQPYFNAAIGYDLVTGWGTPKVAR
jgi:subtilase family serine protease